MRYLRRLGFTWKRPKRRFVKANAGQRSAFVADDRALVDKAAARTARRGFADEAHCRADGDLRGMGVQRGEEALVESTSARYGEKASYYAAVCLETGAIGGARVEGTTSAATSVRFLQGLREDCSGELIVIWDNGPAHHGDALREYLKTPNLQLRLVALPAYSPDYNPAAAIGKWVREGVTADTCFGTAAATFAAVTAFLEGLDGRVEAGKRRCRSELQTTAFPETSRHPERRARRLEQRRTRAVPVVQPM